MCVKYFSAIAVCAHTPTGLNGLPLINCWWSISNNQASCCNCIAQSTISPL